LLGRTYRCREKQRKEATRLLALNEKLKAMNKVLVKQNDNLSKQAFQFVSQNNFLRRQLKLLKEQSTNLDGSKVVSSFLNRQNLP
jgi:homeobox-leucine zipper protein